MEEVEVLLLPEGDGGSGFRTKNEPGEKFRKGLVDRGEALVTKAAVVNITHGTLTAEDEELATLLVFEFRFMSMKSSRRFIRATVTLTFEDADGSPKLDPEVYRIAPEGSLSLNKTTSVKNVKHSANAGFNAGFSGASGNAGYVWEMEEAKSRDHYTRLLGIKKLLGRTYGKENSVVWTLEENDERKDGIPSFLRAAVLLRREDDVPFRFTIKVRTDVDFVSEIKSLFGIEKPDPVDPVDINPDVNPKDLRVETLNPAKVDLTNMRDLNLKDQADVVVTTLMQTGG
jgi:hypothetical protein